MNRGRGDFICAGFARAAAFTAPSCLAAGRKFAIAFLRGSSGIKADQGSAIEVAPKHGFDSVEPFGPQLPEEGGAPYVDVPIAAGLRWAAARLTVGLRADHATFRERAGEAARRSGGPEGRGRGARRHRHSLQADLDRSLR